MLSYPVAEAEELLESKLAVAKNSLENCEEDLDFLRQQITVSHSSSRHVDTVLIPLSMTVGADFGGECGKII